MTKNRINFLYLGGDKCGSTWIHHILSQHPEVCLARAKELFFFDQYYDKGWDWYLRQFPTPDGAFRVGEICHDYLYSDIALKRIAVDLGSEAVFLVSLREPLERAVSQYRYMLKVGHTKLPFREAVDAFPQLTSNSLYSSRIEAAQRVLGCDRVKILWFDDLKSDPVSFGRMLSEALGISFQAELPYTDRVLEGTAARLPAIVKVLRGIGWKVRKMGFPALVGQVKSHPVITSLLYSSNTCPTRSDNIVDSETRARLAKVFTPDIARLEQLTSTPLPDWHAKYGTVT